MASKGQSGLGFTLSIGAQTPTTGIPGADTYIVIGDVTDAPFKRGAWKTVSTTNFQSTTEEMNPVIKAVGTIALKGNRVSSDAGQIIAEAAYQSGLPYDFKTVFPINQKAGQTTQGDSSIFSAYVLSNEFNISPEGIITFDMNLQIINNPTITVGS